MKQASLLMAGMITAGQSAASGVQSPPVVQPDELSIKAMKTMDGEKLLDTVVTKPIAPPELGINIQTEDNLIESIESKAEIRRKHLLKKLRESPRSWSSSSQFQSISKSDSTSNHSKSNSTSILGRQESPIATDIFNQSVPSENNPKDNQENQSIIEQIGEHNQENPTNQNQIRESAPVNVTPELLPIDQIDQLDKLDKLDQLDELTIGIPTQPKVSDGMEQVTSVSQLDDVQSADWAFTALQTLVERYGCIAGYPDGTFRGQRTMTRYEFAAGVNACWERINELIAQNSENKVTQDDLVALQRLQTEFATEIQAIQTRVDDLEIRNAQLQANQFSATTKLIGQAIISVQGTNSPDMSLFPGDERKGETNVTMASSSQLTLATSFTGRDLLLTGLAGGNLGSTAPQVFSNMGRLGFESDTGNNDIYLNELSYRFPLGDDFGVVIGTAGVNPVNTFRGINPLEGSGDGSISLFGQRNPILAIGGGRTGVGFDWQISDRVSLQGVYTTETANFPNDAANAGLIGGRYTLGTQVTLAPTDTLDVGIHYLFNHAPDDNLRTGIGDTQLTSPFAPPNAFDTHAVGATVAWRVNPNLQLGGWGGWTFSRPVDLSGSVETTNWGVFAALPNLFRPGNLGGVIFGQPPKITSSTLPDGYNLPNFAVPDFDNGGGAGGRDDTALHLEMFYRAQITNNLSLTPGVFLIFNPNHNQDNDTLVVGTLRATFRF